MVATKFNVKHQGKNIHHPLSIIYKWPLSDLPESTLCPSLSLSFTINYNYMCTILRGPEGRSLRVGMGDNCAILDFSQRHLTGHSWTYLRNFWFCRIFFRAKLPPGTAKTVFENPKGPPFGCWKKNSSDQVFIKAMLWHLFSLFQNGITLGYCKYFL